MPPRIRPADLAMASRVIAELRSGAAREHRKAAGVSAAAVAAVIGVSREAVRSWEAGGYSPSVEHALAYGKVLAGLVREAA